MHFPSLPTVATATTTISLYSLFPFLSHAPPSFSLVFAALLNRRLIVVESIPGQIVAGSNDLQRLFRAESIADGSDGSPLGGGGSSRLALTQKTKDSANE